jgi:hypothetical protein
MLARQSEKSASIPHVMYYAPYVTNHDIGGSTPEGMYHFVILHGAHGDSIQLLGQTERAPIAKEYEEMLTRLCKINKEWCSPVSENK